jgi:hypothetical protein
MACPKLRKGRALRCNLFFVPQKSISASIPHAQIRGVFASSILNNFAKLKGFFYTNSFFGLLQCAAFIHRIMF